MSKPYIAVILGTAREQRQSERVTEYLLDVVKELDADFTLVDVKDHLTLATIPAWIDDPSVKKWKEVVDKADGYIFVVPEYNHHPPGELKIALDKALEEYAGKPVGLCTVSSGGFGGSRVAEHMYPLLIRLGMCPSYNLTIHISNVKELFEKGNADLDDRYKEKMIQLTQGLIDILSNG